MEQLVGQAGEPVATGLQGRGDLHPQGGRGRAALLRRMDQEWHALQGDDAAATACRRWSVRDPVLAGCSSPAAVLGRVAGAPDRVLLVLLEEAVGGDALAARVVVQALLPKMVRMAARDPEVEVDDYLTALWCEVVAYPVGRRQSSVAANLALDTLKAVRRERRPRLDVAMPPDVVVLAADRRPGHVVGHVPTTGERDPSAAAVLELAREHRLVDPATRALLHSVYAEGLSGAAAARRHGLTPVAVRSRCSRAVRLLARHPALLAEAR